MFAPFYEKLLWISVLGGIAALFAGASWAILWAMKQARRLDAIERHLGLVSKIQRSDRVEPQQVVAKRPESS